MPRKQKILVGLLVTLALALAYRLTNPFEQETVQRLPYARATRVTPPKSASDSETKLRLDLLESPPKYNIALQRDLFRPPKAAASFRKNGQTTGIRSPAAAQNGTRKNSGSVPTLHSLWFLPVRG